MALDRNKKIVTIALVFALTPSLTGCDSVKENEVSLNVSDSIVSANSEIVNSQLESASDLLPIETKDSIAVDYMNDLVNEAKGLLVELKDSSSLETVKEKGKEIAVKAWDFLNNKTSINGVYFQDLSEQGKESVKSIAGLLSISLNMIAPNLGENIESFVGTDVINSAHNAGSALADLGESLLDFTYENTDEMINGFRH